MSRATIDFGIDLGTTNSSIAVLDGNDIHVIRNNENSECTPSTIWIDKHGQLFRGRQAYEYLEKDPENAFGEFKLQMGTPNEYSFVRSGRRMKPEQLSAEVLKSLKEDVLRSRSEIIQAAVITVPAAFELPQCEATKKAAQSAGLSQTLLLQEPVAAAMAYGYQTKKDKVFWLVYDFGGGTFDAAIVSIRDGEIRVVNHGGDNHLGGKLIDRSIIDELLVPAIIKDRRLTDFRRGNPKWLRAFAKLKHEAEEAKIRVSTAEAAPIHIEYLCNDDHGDPVEFEFQLKREDVERVMGPLILRSINICKKVLEEKRLGPGDVEKVLLVGGPTQAPFLRRCVADSGKGLGIALDFSIDPMTAVARGAAIFVGTQRLAVSAAVAPAGEFSLELDYKPVGSDPEPIVGGKVSGDTPSDLSNFTIEFVNASARPPWRSGKTGLSPDGVFMATLWAEKGRENMFEIALRDSSGEIHRTTPDRIAYRIGLVITDPPLTHSVGVALANNDVVPFLEKGSPLPARRKEILRTALEVRRGQSGELVRVPIVEGENRTRADRNRRIGEIVVPATGIKRDLPAGSEVEVAIEIDASRLVTARAYIPVLDLDVELVLNLAMEQHDVKELRVSADAEKKRLAAVKVQADNTGDGRANQALQVIEGERMVQEVETGLAAAQDDPDAADKCSKRLLDLKQALDTIEDDLEWPALVAEAEQEITLAKQIGEKYGKNGDQESIAVLIREIRQTIQTRDPDVLKRKVNEIAGVRVRLLREQPGYWVNLLDDLDGYRGEMRDPVQADALFTMGRRAIQNGDVPGLKSAVGQLLGLLTEVQKGAVTKGFGSTVLLG